MPKAQQIVILAGGLATRLRPLTETIPKALIPIHNLPFVHYQLDWLARCGITRVVFSIGYLGHLIRDFVQDGARWGLKVQYVDEGSELQGTAGALRLALDQNLLEDRFLVTYGDSFLPIAFHELAEQFCKQSRPALMSILKNDEKWDTSNVCFDGDAVTLYDKKHPSPKPKAMQYIDYGVSAFQKAVIESQVPSGQKADLADLFHKLSTQNLLAGYEVKERFYEIGSHSGIHDFESYTQTNAYRSATSRVQT